ncbi:MAG: CDGSH iron-sulfur domain-containing protein [Gemmatimonadota bacterium]|nr:CDGSH iron-sulfur domain-containing protein [Gemmatimonadota bacterium]
MSDIKITFTENGPIRVDGLAEAYGHDGTTVTLREGKPSFLCRCGRSSNKPFCDGSHRTAGFDGTLAASE